MKVVIQYTRGKNRGKYVAESVTNPYWDEVSSVDNATDYGSIDQARKKIDQLCARVGDELYLTPKEIQ